MRRLIGWIKPQSQPHSLSPQISLWRKIKIGFLSLFAIATASTIGMAMLDREKLINDLLTMSGNAGLVLTDIQVRGRAHTPQSRLLTALNLQIGAPIFGIDLQNLHRNISQIGWVEDAIIERRLPGTIHITLRERVPIALLQNKDKHKLIDRSGAIIDGADPSQFTHLTVVAGDSAAPHAAAILSILKTEPELFSEVWAVSYRSKRRWDVHLKNGMEVRLPEIDPVSAWSRLAMIDRKKAITHRDLAVIDMRIPQQLIVEPNIPVRGRGSKT
ncbi:MAG: FtsQ-type POTRA domain-containing protein [Alphaproteobacteria bacterium]|jgi:cell division protein FtsQ|nr:FtsQ-type POTRA domain-containing protein [Candidatus Puniceispirillum sp.]MDP4632290.1 FtsQ-type POTRA domain-containing protein [Porticoccaceae bacterium]MDP4784741.1 FtsQ-type POTRA domain-containing protein [Alphaproteobacteria bacterium]MDP4924434.1 FtsQ-type POTRA domain-containing protein [Alphaproteobacteria bacterium]